MILFRDQIQDSYTGSRSPALSKERRCRIRSGMTGRDCHPVMFLYGISFLSTPPPSSRNAPIRDLALALSRERRCRIGVRHDGKGGKDGFSLLSLFLSSLLPRTWTRSVGTRNLGATRRNRSSQGRVQALGRWTTLLVLLVRLFDGY